VAISLAPRKDSGSLLTISANRANRINRMRVDLDKNFIEESAQEVAYQQGLPYIDLYGYPIDFTKMTILTKEQVEQYRIGVFSVADQLLYVATDKFDPLAQTQLMNHIKELGYTIKLFLCSSLSIDKIINSYNHLKISVESSDAIVINQGNLDDYQTSLNDLSNLQDIIMKSNVSDSIQSILTAAVINKASDIHFEPEKESYNIRYRLDGVLYTYATLPNHLHKQLESRLKILSGVKINIENIPQDGRFSFKYLERDIDVRVSMLPSNYGYSIVMRLLGTGNVELKLEDLGFDGINKVRIEHAINKPQGLILTTGPTGSGKTTTLYTLLSELNDGSNKIITLEDPIEYKLAGISQTQIDAEDGFTFASGLRSILRQDPDILMVGEIRDGETADIAVQASLTGHQVLSTIHTNDAAGSIPRLLEMGIKGFILADAVEVIIGQRLIRKICQTCKDVDTLDTETQTLINAQIEKLPPDVKKDLVKNIVFYTSKGCAECRNIGYKGRVGVYEVMSMTDGLKELMSTKFPSVVEIRNTATQEGMVTMLQDGILKAIKGLTDIKELLKNVGGY
jgi:type IV pilus assembly protein PilB